MSRSIKRGSRAPSVLFLVENLPIPLDRRVWLEANSLRDRGYKVSVVCPKMHGYNESYEQIDGIDIFRFPHLFESQGILGYLIEYPLALMLMFWLALRVWFKSGIDIIHIANPPDLLFFVALPFTVFGKRLIYDQHDLCPELYQAKGKEQDWLYRLLLILERISYRLADAVIVPNQSYREIALQRGKVPPESLFVVRNGPLVDALVPGRTEASSRLIGYVGVMGDQDGVDVIVEVAAKLKNRYPDLKYILLGDGTHRAYCEEYAERLGVSDRIRFTGMVDEKRMGKELSRCALCLVPDRVNEFTARSTMNKVMEYMSLAKPMVQFDTPEGRYSAENASLYAKAGDTDDFVERVAELLDNPTLAIQMGKYGRRRFLNALHWGHSIKVLYAAYDHAQGHSQRKRTKTLTAAKEPSERVVSTHK